MEDPLVWPSWDLASKIAQHLDAAEANDAKRKLKPSSKSSSPVVTALPPEESDWAELKCTVNFTRTKLVPFLSSPIHDVAFDVCVLGLKCTLERLNKLLVGADSEDTSTEEWLQRKILIYREDFALKQRIDQFMALFPKDGECKGANMIVDPDAREFWRTAFGEKYLLVPWNTFFKRLQERLDKDHSKDEAIVKAFIDFTNDGFVTPYEFNVFMLWFGPFHGCCKRMIKPMRAGLLSGFVPAIEATHLLEGRPPGTFMVRFSKTQLGAFAVAFVDKAGRPKHCLLYSVQPAGVTLKHPPQVYRSLTHFTMAHTSKLRYPIGLRTPVPAINNPSTPGPSSPPSRPSIPYPTKTPVKGGKPGGVAPSPKTDRRHPTAETNDSPETEQEWGGEQEDLCSVCLDAPPQTCFLECGHYTCCKECATRVTDCPICRQRITRVINIFKP